MFKVNFYFIIIANLKPNQSYSAYRQDNNKSFESLTDCFRTFCKNDLIWIFLQFLLNSFITCCQNMTFPKLVFYKNYNNRIISAANSITEKGILWEKMQKKVHSFLLSFSEMTNT